jgi:hypothetical protein
LDGVMVYDSLAGPALAARFDAPVAPNGAGNGVWREFTLYRAVPPDASRDRGKAELTITFVLTGLGEAWIDDVTIEVAKLGE